MDARLCIFLPDKYHRIHKVASTTSSQCSQWVSLKADQRIVLRCVPMGNNRLRQRETVKKQNENLREVGSFSRVSVDAQATSPSVMAPNWFVRFARQS